MIQNSKFLYALNLLFLIPAFLTAQVPEGGSFINTQTGNTFSKNGKCTAVEVPVVGQEFTTAIKVEVGTDVSNTWDAQLSFPPVAGVEENDVVLVAFWARTTASNQETGEGSLNVIIEQKVSYTKQLYTNVLIGGEWKEYYTPAKMTDTWTQSEISLLFHIGFPSQTIEVAEVRYLNYKQSLNLEDLPETEITYVGQEPDAAWRGPAAERISQIRKGGATITVYDESGVLLENADVQVEMVKHQFGFGTCIKSSEFNNNSIYRNIILEQFNEVVFENDLKWPQFINSSTHARISQTMDSLEAHEIAVRGHNVIWPSWRSTPDIAEDLKDDPEGLRNLIDEHFDEVTSFTKGRLVDWDVMNEPFSEHDIQDVLGDEVMADWFNRTRRNDRGVKLYINDYGILSGAGSNQIKQDYYYGLIQDIEAWGGEINGIGMQGHFGTDLTSISKIYEILERFAVLEKDIKITEFDVNTTQSGVQTDYTRDFMTILFSHPSAKSILVWGFWEDKHWRPDAAFYNSDWSIRPHGVMWNDMIFSQWWTPKVDAVSDVGGQVSFEGYLGTYSYTVTEGDNARSGTFTLDHSFQSGLDNSIVISMDESVPESVEIQSSVPGFACSGEDVLLLAPSGEGLSYEWELDGNILEEDNDSLKAVLPGSYSVTVSKSGISTKSEPFMLELRESPNEQLSIDGELEFCEGETVALSVPSGSDREYDWYMDGSRVQWGDTILDAGKTGSYSLGITSGGCTSVTDIEEVVVNTAPDAKVHILGTTTLCEGESVNLRANMASGQIYNWYRGDELLDETSYSLQVSESGTYSLTVSNEKCSSTSLPTEVTVLAANDPHCTVGVEEEMLSTKIFPNPSRGIFHLEFSMPAGAKASVEVYDAVGNLVLLKQAESGFTQMTLNIETPGLYMLRIKRGVNTEIHKLICK